MRRMTTANCCLAAVWLIGLAAAALARPGTVLRTDGSAVRGDVHSSDNRLTVTLKNGGSVELDPKSVDSIVYAESVKDEFDQRLASLGERDVSARLNLASWAMDEREFDLAMDAVDTVLDIEPRNARAQGLVKTVQLRRQQQASVSALARSAQPKLAGARTAARPAAIATTRPTTRPATQPTTVPTTVPARPIRMVTPREVNRIRQLEWGQGDKTVRVRLDQELRRRYLEQADIQPAQFMRLSVIEQARRILEDAPLDIRDDLVIANDPAPLLEYRRQVQRTILPGCATANCHGGPEVSRFRLHVPGDQDVAAYTNFYILQNHEVPLKGGGTAMVIDHTRPEDSLLLQYGLPQDAANMPHPKAANFKPVFKSRNDPHYREVEQWISKSLATVKPDYQIDLSRAAEKTAGVAPATQPAQSPAVAPARARGAPAPAAPAPRQ